MYVCKGFSQYLFIYRNFKTTRAYICIVRKQIGL